MVAWLPGRLSLEQYSGRRDACTAQELNLLLASPEFRRWQHQKASREARWRTLLSYGGVAALCLLLSVALSPPPSSLGRLEGVGSLELLAVTAGNVSSWRAPLPVGLSVTLGHSLLPLPLKGIHGGVVCSFESVQQSRCSLLPAGWAASSAAAGTAEQAFNQAWQSQIQVGGRSKRERGPVSQAAG